MHLKQEDLTARIPDHYRVLDLGGWERTFPRADVVVDLNSYETRRVLRPDIPERFSKDDWIIADFCSPAFWSTIPDKAFDFIIVSHTLEDIRDPLYVCSQMIRCGRSGYIEAPSKFIECAKPSKDSKEAGFTHHRWIIEPNADRSGLVFKAKLAWAHAEDYLGDARRHHRKDFFKGFTGYHWTGSFSYVEHFQKGMALETADLFHFYDTYDYKRQQHSIDLKPNASSKDDGRCLWVDEYLLPVQQKERSAV